MKHALWLCLLGLMFTFGCDSPQQRTELGRVSLAGGVGAMPLKVCVGDSSGHQSSFGQTVFFTAFAGPNAVCGIQGNGIAEQAPAPTGPITLHIDGRDFPSTSAFPEGSVTFYSFDGISDLNAGSYNATATFNGDPTYAVKDTDADGVDHFTVHQLQTITGLEIIGATTEGDGAPGAYYGETVTFRVHVRGAFIRCEQCEGKELIGNVSAAPILRPSGDVSLRVDSTTYTATLADGADDDSIADFTFPNTSPVHPFLTLADELPHGLLSSFLGSQNWAESNDGEFEEGFYVFPADTNVQISSISPTVSGATQKMTLTASVTTNTPGDSTAKPDGTVDFYFGDCCSKTGPLPVKIVADAPVTNGTAQGDFTPPGPLAPLVNGTNYTFFAVYNAGPNFNNSDSTNFSHLIDQTQQFSVTLTTDASSEPSKYTSTYGVPVVAAVTIVGNFQQPTGTVTLTGGATGSWNIASIVSPDTSTVVENVRTTVLHKTLNLPVGTYTLTASYGGDGVNYINVPNVPATDTQSLNVVAHGTDITNLTTSPNPSTYGQLVTFSATITAPKVNGSDTAATPAGHVDFFEGAKKLGTGTVNVSDGKASASTHILGIGDHPYQAVFVPDSTNYNGKTLAHEAAHVVQQATTVTALISQSNPIVFGDTTNLVATVSAPNGSWQSNGSGGEVESGDILDGTVTFNEGATVLGTVTGGATSGKTRTFTFPLTTGLSIGTHNFTATFGGNARFLASAASTPLAQVVNKDGTSGQISTSLNPAGFGIDVTFTITVSSTIGNAPTGTVTLKDGTNPLGTLTLTGSPSQATYTTNSLSVGTHTMSIVYNGDAEHEAGPSASIIQTIQKAPTTTALTTSGSPTLAGQAVKLTATVTSASSASKVGVVTFKDGTTVLGTALASDVGGVATFTTSSLSVGTHALVASYEGNASLLGSTGSATQTVGISSAQIQLTSSLNPSLINVSVNLIATVNASNANTGIPSGKVTFKDGATVLGIAQLDATGVATFPTSSLALGAHTITAVYAGDTRFATVTSNALTQNVNATAAIITVTTSPSAPVWGDTVTITAHVTGSGATQPTGTVTFSNGAGDLGTITLDASGNATVTTTTLPVGPNSFNAHFNGDATYAAGNGTGNLAVAKAPTTITIAATPNPAPAGTPVTVTATVTSPVAGFTGEVEFFSGSTSLGTVALTGATATFTATTLVEGTYPINAKYLGDDHFLTSTSTAVSQTISANPDAGGGSGNGSSSSGGNSANPNGADSGLGNNLNITPGGNGGNGDDCAVTTPGFPLGSGFSWIAGLALSALLVLRRRRR